MGGEGGELVIRADAGPHIGTGHVMRCLALAQSWGVQGGDSTFVMSPEGFNLRHLLEAEGIRVVSIELDPGTEEDARRTSQLAEERDATWVVVDGYHFTGAYQEVLKEAGRQVMVVDDNGHAERYVSDLVLNQNLHAEERMYRNRRPYTRLLLGTQYVLLRREFWPWKGVRRTVPERGSKALFLAGGSDPQRMLPRLLRELDQTDVGDLEGWVGAGRGATNLEAIKALARSVHFPVEILLDGEDMASAMASADVAVSAAGSTSLELAFMGLPSILWVAAENQRDSARELARQGVFTTFGAKSKVSALVRALLDLISDRATRKAQSERGRRLVDGEGNRRVLRALTRSSEIDSMTREGGVP